MALEYTHVVVHYSEIGLKGKNRAYFERRLLENIQNQLKDNIKRAYRTSGKIILELKTGYGKFGKTLGKIPGVANFSPSLAVKTDLTEIKKAAFRIAKEKGKKSFKIITTRTWKQFPITSQQVNEKVGEHVLKKTGIKVNVKTPALKIFIEINKEATYAFPKKYKSIGGLPVGSAGKVVSLISGGIDSPVASYMMMKRGARVIFAHCMNKTLVTGAAKNKVKELVRILGAYQWKPKLYIIPFEEIQKEIIKTIPAKYRMIIYRRFMLRIAEKIMLKEKAKAIVTGDSLSQVASQTLENLDAIRNSTSRVVLSPLIGMNKDEIIELGKEIGTYETSIRPYPDCCSYLIAKHPEIRGRPDEMEKLEKHLDVKTLVNDAVGKTELVKF